MTNVNIPVNVNITSANRQINTENLAVGYGKKIVIDEISINVEEGKIVTLIGPNGSGKSTILKTITGALDPLGGAIFIQGRPKQDMTGGELAKSLSMVMTDRIQPELMTCWDVVATGRYPYTGRFGILTEDDRRKVDEALTLTHADEVANESFLQISDGQRQRVMLARAICQDTPILILDEPTSFLDMHYKLDLLKTIHKLAKQEKKAILMSLHELDLAKMISDEVICVSKNKIVKIGSPNEVYTGTFLQELFGVGPEEFDPETGRMHLVFGDDKG